MWPDNGFAVPVGSFVEAVSPPGVDPTSGDCVILRVNRAWIPYITGALLQLVLETTWNVTGDALNTVQAQAMTLIAAINDLEPGDCGKQTAPQAIEESEYQMSICEQLRFQNGKLQGYCCGEWVDIAGQSSQGNPVVSQPGQGSPVPAPNGGQKDYCGGLGAQQTWLLPVPVSSGDELLFHQLQGAWNDTREIIWNCPDGWVYALGACGQTLPHGSPDPVPGALHMQIIAFIAGNYYDCLGTDVDGNPTPFTVPGGISNAQVVLQANIDDIEHTTGDIGFCVTVTNNQVGSWTHDFQLETNPGGFTALSDGGTFAIWSPSDGWIQANDDLGSCPPNPPGRALLWISRLMPTPRYINTIRIVGETSTDLGPGSGARQLYIDGVGSSLGIDSNVGDFDITLPVNATVNTSFSILINSICVADLSTVIIHDVIVTGQGVDPF